MLDNTRATISDNIDAADNCNNLIIQVLVVDVGSDGGSGASLLLFSRGATIYRLRAHRRRSAIRLMSFTCPDSRVP